MEILKKLQGSTSSEVYLVDINKEKFVLKRCEESDEIVSEKKFIQILSENSIPALNYFDSPDLEPSEILLEYIENSTTLWDNLTEENCKICWETVKKIHSITYQVNENNLEERLNWSLYLRKKIDKAFTKAKENNNYGFKKEQLEQITKYLSALLDVELKDLSLIHGDFHVNNVFVKNGNIILFDKNPEIFYGDPLLDLSIFILNMPNNTLLITEDPVHINDKKYLNSFISGYGTNFLDNPTLDMYIMLIAFGRLYTPYSNNYKQIIINLLNKANN